MIWLANRQNNLNLFECKATDINKEQCYCLNVPAECVHVFVRKIGKYKILNCNYFSNIRCL